MRGAAGRGSSDRDLSPPGRHLWNKLGEVHWPARRLAPGGLPRPAITRLYIYDWTGGTSRTPFDAGLMDAHDHPRPC